MSTPRGPPMLGGEKLCCNWQVAARHRELMLWKCGISSFLILPAGNIIASALNWHKEGRC